MSKGASKVQVQGGPQLSSVICGAADDMVSAKLNLNCPLGIFLSYALQSLKVELDNKVSDINDQADQVMPIVPLDTAEDQLEEVTNTAKDAAAAKKEQLHELGRKLREMGTKIASSTAHYIDLLDENNVIMQCQENIKLNASEILKPFGKYTIGILQESEIEPLSVLPCIVGASAIAMKKGK